MLPLFLSPRGDSGSGDTSRGRAGSPIAERCSLSGTPHRQSRRGVITSLQAASRNAGVSWRKQPGAMARRSLQDVALWGQTGLGTRMAGGTRMTRVVHRQVTLMAKGCSRLGTHVAKGQV